MKELIIDIFKWILNNRDWFFSGAGISIIGLMVYLFNKTSSTSTGTQKNTNTTYNVYYNQTHNQNKENIERNNDVYNLVDRFINIYTSHGISINQISSFIDQSFNLKISDFKDKDSILNILDDDILHWTCETFGIDRAWLDGKEKRIYPYRDYYKQVRSFLKLLSNLLEQYNQNHLEIFLIKSGQLNPKVYGKTYVFILLRIPIKQINNRPIYKYIPVTTNWDWGYWRSRYQLKSIIYFIQKLNIYTHGYDLSDKSFSELSGGYRFPEPEINKLKIGYTWYPEDYIDLPSHSLQAKEIEETEDIRNYIEKEGYHSFFNSLKKYSSGNFC